MAARLLLVIGGDPAAHPFHVTSPLICRNLLTGGFQVAMEPHLERFRGDIGPVSSEFDVLVLHGRFPARDDALERGIESFVHSGKGLVIIHIASNSFEFSSRWRKLAGRVWEYGGPQPFTSSHPDLGSFRVDISGTAHPVTSQLAPFDLASDERYQDLLVAPNARIHDLATATLEGRTEPVAWVLTPPEGGRVFHVTIGHGTSTYDNPGFQELVSRGVRWAAGVDV
jgi:type 1 glutamine amidotransferase